MLQDVLVFTAQCRLVAPVVLDVCGGHGLIAGLFLQQAIMGLVQEFDQVDYPVYSWRVVNGTYPRSRTPSDSASRPGG